MLTHKLLGTTLLISLAGTASPQAPDYMEELPDEMYRLHPKRHVVPVVGRRHLLVSSRVLELSSPFFKKMLQSNAFMEGADQPNAEKPPIKQLQENYPDIFYLICVVLQYLPAHPPDSIDDYRSLTDLCKFLRLQQGSVFSRQSLDGRS